MQTIRAFIAQKEIRLACIFLLLPLLLSAVMVIPHYEEYTSPGDIEPVSEIGIDGHVYFTYVNSGITRNYYEKYLVWLQTRDQETSFVPLETDALIDSELLLEEAEAYKLQTIDNAVAISSQLAESPPVNEGDKYKEIIEQAKDYYGDSLGLMAAIGLVEEWNHEDFSKAGKYLIAGTGTIEEDHTVGSIGAIKEKLLAASKRHVDCFLLPKDKESYYFDGLSNQEEAEAFVKERNLQLKLVPVRDLEEALRFLRSLP